MLQNIRSKTHGVIAWIVIIVIGFVFAVWGIEGYLSSGSNEVANVNGEVITVSELQRTYQHLLRQQQLLQATQGAPAVEQAVIEQQAISGLISERMLSTIASRQGFAVGKDQVDNLLRMLPQFQDESGNFSPDKFKQVLSQMGFTPQEFRTAVENDLMIGQVRSSIVDSAFVLNNELNSTISLLEQTRDIQYVLIPAADFLTQANITQEEVKTYYEANPAEFMLPERISIQYVRLNAEALAVAEADDQALQDFYQTHLSEYTEPEKRHVAHILLTEEKVGSEQELDALAEKLMQELKQGADFAVIATEYSADPGSSTQGGDLGWFSRGVMVPEFENAVFAAQSGELVGPVKTEFGVHLIKIIAVQAETVPSFDAVKEQVGLAWQQDQRETLFAEESSKLDNLAFESPEQLDNVATSLNLPIQKTELFSRDETQPLGAIDVPSIVEAAFSDTVLLENRNSSLVYLTPSDVIVLRKLDYKDAELQPLASVEEAIKNKLALTQAAKLTEEKANTWLKELKSGVSAEQLNITWLTVDKTNRYNFSVPPEVLDTAFILPIPNEQTGIVGQAIPVGTEDYAVLIVKAVYPGELDPTYAEDLKKEYVKGMTSFKGELDYQLYVAAAQKASKIEVNTQ